MSIALVASPLVEQEAIIERGLTSIIEVGHALMKIRDEELYRQAGFDGFVAYLESKPWGISQGHARRMIDAAPVVEAVAPIGAIPEGQARELAPLLRRATPEVVKQLYAEVIEESNGNPTAARIREKVKEILPPRERRRASVVVDLRPEGLAETVTAIRDLVSVLGLIRGNTNAPVEQVHAAIKELEWIIEEVQETLRVLVERGVE